MRSEGQKNSPTFDILFDRGAPEIGELFGKLFTDSPTGISLVDTKGKFFCVNPSFCTIMGYTEQELYGMTFMELTHPDHIAQDVAAIKKLIRGESSSYRTTKRYVRKDGNSFWASLTVNAIKDSNGRHLYQIGMVEDISEQRLLEEAMRESKAAAEKSLSLSRFPDENPNPILRVTRDGTLIYANRGSLSLLNHWGCKVGDSLPTRWLKLAQKSYASESIAYEEEAYASTVLSLTLTPIQGSDYINIYGIDITDQIKVMHDLKIRSHDLLERLKELNCLYHILKIRVDRSMLNLDDIFSQIVELIPPSWQYPHITCSRLLFKGKTYATPNFRETDWRLSSDIRISGVSEGVLEVFYLKEMPAIDEGPFMKDERKLIDAITDIIGKILEQDSMEKALRVSEERFRTLFEQAAVGVAQIESSTGRFHKINQKYCDIVGYTRQEMELLTFPDITHPDDLETDLKNKEMLLSGKVNEFSREKRYIHKNGDPVWVHLTASAMWKPGEQADYYIAIAEDINQRKRIEHELHQYQHDLEELVKERTMKLSESNRKLIEEIKERKAVEGALQKSEREYRNLVDNSMTGVFKSNLKGDILYVNNALCRILEYDSANELREKGALARYKNSADRERFISILKENRNIINFETEVFKKGGDTALISLSATLEKGNISGTVIDISERKNLEEQLLQSQKMESIGTLAGGVAHDFNNTLTAIIGFASIINRKIDKDNPLKFYVDQIEMAAENASHLTERLLAFSRKQKFTLQPYDCNMLVKKSEKLLLQITGENILFNTELVDTDIPVMMDVNHMQQVLINLTANARDAMPGGGTLTVATEKITIDSEFIKAHGFGRPGLYALVSISDTGIGMDENTTAKVFEPFFTLKEVGKGTGLGMSIAYSIVKQHKGEIQVESVPDQGTSINIYLPVTENEVEQNDKGKRKDSSHLRGTETILVAEDNPVVMTVLNHTLSRSGYRVIQARDGEEAIQAFNNNHADIKLIISDVVMPKKNGMEAYEKMKDMKPDIKCLFLSGYTPEEIYQTHILEKEAPFMSKPVRPDDLLHKVRELIGKQ